MNQEVDKNRLIPLLNTIQRSSSPYACPWFWNFWEVTPACEDGYQMPSCSYNGGQKIKVDYFPQPKVWCNRWKQDFIKLKFGTKHTNRNLIIWENQLSRIFTINKPAISLEMELMGAVEGDHLQSSTMTIYQWYSKELQNRGSQSPWSPVCWLLEMQSPHISNFWAKPRRRMQGSILIGCWIWSHSVANLAIWLRSSGLVRMVWMKRRHGWRKFWEIYMCKNVALLFQDADDGAAGKMQQVKCNGGPRRIWISSC